jgi:hypothetical protein
MTGTSILAQYYEPAVARVSPQSGAVTPTTYPPPYLSPMGTWYHHHGCTVPTASGSCQCRAGLASPGPPGAVVLVGGDDHRQAARFPTFWEPMGSGVLVNISYTCPVGSELER